MMRWFDKKRYGVQVKATKKNGNAMIESKYKILEEIYLVEKITNRGLEEILHPYIEEGYEVHIDAVNTETTKKNELIKHYSTKWATKIENQAKVNALFSKNNMKTWKKCAMSFK